MEGQQQYPQDGERPADGERGLGGAITGGLAGGWGGHAAGHGILGTIGGAILGSFAEDKLKKHHQEKEQSQHRRAYGKQGGMNGQGQHSFPSTTSFNENVNFGK